MVQGMITHTRTVYIWPGNIYCDLYIYSEHFVTSREFTQSNILAVSDGVMIRYTSVLFF